MDITTHLIELYQKTSKHSNYQVLPECLKTCIENCSVTTKSRNEPERLTYILKNLPVAGKSVMDIGGNTGYFTFELADAGAGRVIYVEGNKAHADFVQTAVKYLKKENVIQAINQYFDFEDYPSEKNLDIVLLLNVLHHLGDDYGTGADKEAVKKQIIRQLNSIAKITRYCVFQLGFNWKGDRNNCLFEKGTKQEMIDYITGGSGSCWDIVKIGIARREGETILYEDLNTDNIQRDDTLGEFLNRPLFILKSKE